MRSGAELGILVKHVIGKALLECAYHRYKAGLCGALNRHTSRLNDGVAHHTLTTEG